MGTTKSRNPSLWIATSANTGRHSDVLEGCADVVVVGAGVAGLTTARLLASTGRRVLVLEAGEICAGATGYTTAKVTALQSTIYSRLIARWGTERAAVYADANRAAVAKVHELVADDGIECGLTDAAAFTYTESVHGIATIEAEAEAAGRAGLAVSLTTDTDLPFAVEVAVRLDGQAQFHPRRYCLGLVRAIEAAGGSVLTSTRVLAVDDAAGVVTTDRGAVSADAIVLATHIPISDAGAHFARMEPMRSYAAAFRSDTRPAGMYISIDEPVRSIRSTPDGWVIVGGEGHKVGHDSDTVRRYAALERWARERFGPSTIEYRWSAQDYTTADDLPYIGHLTSRSTRTFVATGFGKWGMTNGTVAAMIIASEVDGSPCIWADAFDATRVAPTKSLDRMVRGNLDVAKRFVGDRLRTVHRHDVDSVERGTGAIASRAGDKVAAYRDGTGQLHCVSARCTHLGCQVAFNTAENTWDCPCHGSRFDIHGRVLQGPAVENLPRKAT